MPHLLVFVLDDIRLCNDVLDAWKDAGAPGATILESTGLARIRGAARDDLPLMPSLRDLLVSKEMHHRTLFTVIENEEVIDRVIEATQRVVGDLSEENTGLLFVVPISRVVGLHKRRRTESS